MKKILLFVVSSMIFLLAGCATPLEPEAQTIRMVTLEQKATCESLGLVAADQQLSLHKASNSMHNVLNNAAPSGANVVYLVSQGQSGIDGASVAAEAL